MPDDVFNMSVIYGIPLFVTCIGFSLQLLELLQTVMTVQVLLLTPLIWSSGALPKKTKRTEPSVIDFWHGFLAPLLCGGLGRFLPCNIGGNHCVIACEQCEHGLSSWPRETAVPRALNPLLQLCGYPLGADVDQLTGSRKLRHCRTPFAGRVPTWSLPSEAHAGRLVASDCVESQDDLMLVVSGEAGGALVSGGPGWHCVRLDTGGAGGIW